VADHGSWTALPEHPLRYRLHDRWSDYRCGRADARKGIPGVISERPEVVPPPPAEFDALAAPVPEPDLAERDLAERDLAEPDLEEAATDTARKDATNAAAVPLTPYLYGLRNTRNQVIAGSLQAWYEDTHARLQERLLAAQTRRESCATTMQLAAARLAKVSDPLTDAELNRRGAAERDVQKWPPEMLRERRERDRRLVRFTAEEALRKVTVESRTAELAVENAHLAINDRLRVAQASGWQIIHHYARREATYLRSLARRHKNGPELVRLLELAGPDLPQWLLQIDGKKEGT
jgi:hypothetical protein